MAAQITQVIPSLGTPPTTADPATFDARADTLLGTALPAMVTAENVFATQANALSTEVNARADEAEIDAATASAAAAAADATANAVLWVSGGSYTAGQNRYSPINYLTYRAITTHSGVVTDPSLDATNWVSLAPASAAIGDTLTTAVALSAPAWLPSEGAAYLQSSYPDLFGLLGLLKFDPPEKLADPSTLPTGNGNGTAFSADGTYLAVGHVTSPFITIYKRAGDVFTKLTNPATLPPDVGRGTAFSPDGTYLSVAHFSSPFVTIYKRSGDVFTKLANPATLPPALGLGTAFSPDGTYLSVAHSTSPFITIYKRAGDVFTKLADPATLPTGTGFGTAFSPDGGYLSVAHTTSPFVTIYSAAEYDTSTQFKVTTSPDVDLPLKTFIKAT